MAQVTVDTVVYPAWWATANNVRIRLASGTAVDASKANIELLPQGVAGAVGSASVPALYPWAAVASIEKID